MRYLTLKNNYLYFGDTLIYRVVDIENKEEDIIIDILDQKGSTIISNVGKTNTQGIYEGTCTIQKNPFNTGIYTLKVTIGSDSIEKKFCVDYKGYLIVTGLYTLLQGFLNIPVYNEIGSPYKEGSNNYLKFTFGNWSYDIDNLQFRGNDKELKLFEEIVPNLETGTALINISNYIETYEIFSTYKFKFFQETEFASFLELSLDEINAIPPVTSYNWNNAPRIFDPYLVGRTYTYVLRKILLDMEFWNNRLIFPEPTGLRSTLNTLLSDANNELRDMKTKIKGRWMVQPQGITSFKMGIPYLLNGWNFRYFTIASITGPGV